MLRVHALSGPLVNRNSLAFHAPLFAGRRELRAQGLDVRIFDHYQAALSDCDLLLVDDKHFGERWGTEPGRVIDELGQLRRTSRRLVYCDTGDSSGLLRAAAFPLVDRYFKSFVLRDDKAYACRHYGGRLFTHHYRERFGVEDVEVQWSSPIDVETVGARMRVSWNFGLANHGLLGGVGQRLFRWVAAPFLLRLPVAVRPPDGARPLSVSCRFGAQYTRATVAFQRRRILDLLAGRVRLGRVGRRAFMRELASSKIVVSPFGWGEFAFRDYEAFVGGALLLKPDMSHLETYPDYYRDGSTMVAFRWDLDDLVAKLDAILADYNRFRDIAINAQNLYAFQASSAGRERFADRFRNLVHEALG